MASSRLSTFCDRALEAGWLLGVTITPVFFNVYSSRVFEPDKLTTLRALAMAMAVCWLVRFLDERLRGETPLRFSWRTAMVLPALVTMVIYLISSAFSLVRYTSIVGSYQRLQGTFTLFGYLVLFFALITSLRTRAQLSRLVTVLILNSLPISLYGIIQHNGLDPLPWAGDVTARVASNMGNAIFVAAYLIMIVPLTGARILESFNDILNRKETRVSDILRASGYIFLIVVQLITIWFAQSRGPWLGIVAAGFTFPYLALIMMQRRALAKNAGGTQFQGWRWLWIVWGALGLIAALVLVLVNVPGILQDTVRKVPTLYRLTTITELQGGTGKVRGLIWQGTLNLIKPHDPIEYPDESVDKYNALRPLIGYGPESMYVAYNSFYPPELGHYESRTASPDRSHNETLDSITITGVLGLGAYLFTFLSFFAWGMHWLGLLKTRAQLSLYLGLDAGVALIFFLLAWQLEGAYLFAVAIPLGILVGTMIYLSIQAYRMFINNAASTEEPPQLHPHTMLIIGLLAAVTGHFVEINFGIAIAATRTTFWAMAGILVVLGLQWIPGIQPLTTETLSADSPQAQSRRPSQRRRSSRVRSRQVAIPSWLAAVLALSFIATFLLGTLAFDFINNPERLTDGGQIFVNSLTMKYHPTKTHAYGALMIFIFTWVLFGVIGLSEYDREGLFDENRATRWRTAIGIYAAVSLIGLLIFGSMLAGYQARLTQTSVDNTTLDNLIRDVVGIADALSGLLSRYYGLIFTMLILMALALIYEEIPSRKWGEGWSALAFVVLIILAGAYVIIPGCFNLIRADIIYKQGSVFAISTNSNEKQIGIAHYEKALEYAPREDYYNLFLGKAYLELAQGLPDDTPVDQREAILQKTEDVLIHARELNPLNTDHSANLARFYKSWAARVLSEMRAEGLTEQQRSALSDKYTSLLQQSLENYQIALTLSPNNPLIWNELAQLYAIDFGNDLKFQETISRSLEVDDEFEQTWMLIGDMRSSKGDLPGAITAYETSLKIRDNCTVRRVIGTLQAQQGLWMEATATLIEAVERCSTSSELWDMYRVMAIAYANTNQVDEAFAAAAQALDSAPDEQKPTIEQLIEQLQQQLAPATSPQP